MPEAIEALGRGIVIFALALFIMAIAVFSCAMIVILIRGLKDEAEEARKRRK